MGDDDQLDHDERYDRADEYLDVLYKLWEGSWEDDAVTLDKDGRVFTDPDKVHPIEHHGKHFDVPGIHLCEPSPQRTPVIYQAGASARGIDFAAKHAEAIFVGSTTKAVLAETVRKFRSALVEAGRHPYSARIYSLLTIVTAETSEQAHAKYADYLTYADEEGALVLNSGWMGIDLSAYDPDEPVGNVQSNAIRSVVAGFQQGNEDGDEWTIRDIARQTAIGGLGRTLVGSGEEIADQLQEWVADTDVDGFNLAYAITPGTFADVVEHVVPVLQERGVYAKAYGEGTLRYRLLNRGDRLPAEHRGATMRIGADDVREAGVA